MKSLEELIHQNKKIRVIGFDDAPFLPDRSSPVKLAGIVCSNTRFEGMLWGEVKKDGIDATEVLIAMLEQSKFLDQLHLIITDGIAFGGFNMIDLPYLSERLKRPCIAVMRKHPDLEAINKALSNLPDLDFRKRILDKAGRIHQHNQIHYQVHGCEPDIAAQALSLITDTGNIPEAIRLAHLISSAVMTGESGNRA